MDGVRIDRVLSFLFETLPRRSMFWFWDGYWIGSAASLLLIALWVWMLYHCYREEPDREFWLLIMVIIPPAAVVYFFTRYLRSGSGHAPGPLKRMGRKREIDRLRIAAEQIGNAYQHIEYADALREAGRHAEASDAYDRALAKEPDNLTALWGKALCEMQQDRHADAKGRLEKILAADGQYKFGDVSLAYGKCLCRLHEHERAATHLSRHVDRWRHPEAMYLLATLHAEHHRSGEARDCLRAMLMDIDGSPRAIARRQQAWKRKGKRLLAKLPES